MDYSLRLVLRGLSRLNPHEEVQALPVTPVLLLRLFKVMDFNSSLHRALWSVFLISFFIFARKSNMVPAGVSQYDLKKHLARGDVRTSDTGLVILVKWSKTIQFGQRHLLVPVLAIPGSPLCPRRAFVSMVEALPASLASPAFLYLDSGGRVVTLTHFSLVSNFRALLKRAGVDPVGFSGHSFRRGGASCAFRAGVSGELIRLHGDWHSDAYLKYLTVPMQKKLQVTGHMREYILGPSCV